MKRALLLSLGQVASLFQQVVGIRHPFMPTRVL
jgi:hypothetical protein